MDDPDELGSMASVLRAVAYMPGGDRDPPLAAGMVIDGLYRIERVLGEGGMGTVYLARDLRLGRTVAVKVGRVLARNALARMAREAGALAMLSHPNVVVVHQVGEHERQVYIAMEHVAGTTLREWLLGRRRAWRDVLTMLCAAGDGLAAAHAAGLVHRDFKPDNVLVGDDGRPRVADFGLVRATATPALSSDGREPAASDGEPAEVTRAGAVIGTPAYMAPEQLDGAIVDARGDQFAFAATAWEALFGARPFAGVTPAELRTAISSSPPAAGRSRARGGVPGHVTAALRRALAPAPDDRWPDLAALLAELRRDPARTRRRVAYAGVGLAALGAALIVPWQLRGDAPDPCAGGDARIAEVWSPGAAAGVGAAFAAAGQPWATDAGAKIVGALDGWSARWVAQHGAVCRATWSPALRDRAEVCLARRLSELSAVTDVLGHLPVEGLKRGDDIVATLGRPETCADAVYLAADVTPPSDPGVAAAVAAQEPALSRVNALLAAGRLAEADTEAARLVPAALAIGDPALIARSRARYGLALGVRKRYDEALPELTEAYHGARDVGDRHTAANVAARTAQVLIGLSRVDESITWARLATSDAEASGDARLRSTAAATRAIVTRAAGDLTAARGFADRALAEARNPGATEGLVHALNVRADILGDLGERAAALADLDEAIGLIREAYGSDHYRLIYLGTDRSFALRNLGRYDEAIDEARTALAIGEVHFGPDHRTTGLPRAALAVALGATNRAAEALPLWDKIIADDTAQTPGSWDLAIDHNNHAHALAAAGRLEDAIAAFDRASAIFLEVSGANATELAMTGTGKAGTLLELGRTAEAEAAATQAIAIYARHPDDPAVASSLTVRGGARLARRAFAAAREDLARALALRDRPDAEPVDLARTRLFHAEADAGLGDHARARVLATAALAALRGQDETLAARAEALLARLP